MNNLNSILLEGNLVTDPETKKTPNGKLLCTIKLACNREYKQDNEYQKEVSFFEVTAWGKQAKACGDNLKKGSPIRVIGKLKQDRWTGTDGKQKSKVHIIADHVEFMPSRKKQEAEPVPTNF